MSVHTHTHKHGKLNSPNYSNQQNLIKNMRGTRMNKRTERIKAKEQKRAGPGWKKTHPASPKVKFLANIDNYIKLNEPACWLIAMPRGATIAYIHTYEPNKRELQRENHHHTAPFIHRIYNNNNDDDDNSAYTHLNLSIF